MYDIHRDYQTCRLNNAWDTYEACRLNCSYTTSANVLNESNICEDLATRTVDLDGLNARFLFDDDPSTTTNQIVDSNGNNYKLYYGKDSSSNNAPAWVDGSGINFTADTQMLNFSDYPAYVFDDNQFSLSVWVKPNWTTASENRPILSKVSRDYTNQHLVLKASDTDYIFDLKTTGGIDAGITATRKD